MLSELTPKGAKPAENQTGATFFHSMDYVLYTKSTEGYVTDRVDEFLTILRNPFNHEPVGVKLKGFENLYICLRENCAKIGVEIADVVPFWRFISIAEAMACNVGDDLLEGSQHAYSEAKQIVGQTAIIVDPKSFEQQAA